mmetsp:Transcript_69838/g.194187  ORF Transcript_69838/g.194187 Transcript_69838/m.194187 type:complete len:233 (-) Transcript_69838:380-1078(-)
MHVFIHVNNDFPRGRGGGAPLSPRCPRRSCGSPAAWPPCPTGRRAVSRCPAVALPSHEPSVGEPPTVWLALPGAAWRRQRLPRHAAPKVKPPMHELHLRPPRGGGAAARGPRATYPLRSSASPRQPPPPRLPPPCGTRLAGAPRGAPRHLRHRVRASAGRLPKLTVRRRGWQKARAFRGAWQRHHATRRVLAPTQHACPRAFEAQTARRQPHKKSRTSRTRGLLQRALPQRA